MEREKIDRINELARRKKNGGAFFAHPGQPLCIDW